MSRNAMALGAVTRWAVHYRMFIVVARKWLRGGKGWYHGS
ncbi:hypothetical protein PAMC26577_37610 [Caballeronia sordidicola]|uniref:Uncharacterized protein n=1 Tax=Caballeronia sordidicola TaxID=196367 RepID=A0A242M5Y9_CABSO|nr:hypothetical protein PAMC26577_37610 [Caballeronia sordidicola]